MQINREQSSESAVIGVVLPCYRARSHIMNVLEAIGPEVSKIYVVDDSCPEKTGDHVMKNSRDQRIKVLQTDSNLGVGGAVKLGYKHALADQMDIVVKIDADGQMDPSMIGKFVSPILNGRADYTKGNRFYSLEMLRGMPLPRLLGNTMLSFMTKVSSGYWDLMDPTNGYTAIHSKVLNILPLEKISDSYFFESDMLFRLNTVRAVVLDIPMPANYSDEHSNLGILKSSGEFLGKHTVRFFKRVFYNYFLREFNIASLQTIAGMVLLVGGGCYGITQWLKNTQFGVETPSGTVMLAALPVLVGFQLLLSAINYDIAAVPRNCIHELL